MVCVEGGGSNKSSLEGPGCVGGSNKSSLDVLGCGRGLNKSSRFDYVIYEMELIFVRSSGQNYSVIFPKLNGNHYLSHVLNYGGNKNNAHLTWIIKLLLKLFDLS